MPAEARRSILSKTMAFLRRGRLVAILRRRVSTCRLISPAAALFAVICFFLPWGRVDCATVHYAPAGDDVGGLAWIVLAGALLVVGAGMISAIIPSLRAASRIVAPAALAALAFLIIVLARLSRGQDTLFGRVSPSDVGAEVGFGGIGTVAGLAVALAGAIYHVDWRRLPLIIRRLSPAGLRRASSQRRQSAHARRSPRRAGLHPRESRPD